MNGRSVRGAVIIPAHNEAGGISDTLRALSPLLAAGITIIVAPNGCTDDTVACASAVPGIEVIEVAAASKAAALNAADAWADRLGAGWPRLYLDADVTIDPLAVRQVLALLETGAVLAARPTFRYDTAGCDPWVRAYYRARNRMPGMHTHLWGGGAYALSLAGRRRFGRFPAVTADDLYVDAQFTPDEIAIIGSRPIVVRVPATWRALLATLTRVQRGRSELALDVAVERVGGWRTVLAAVHDPASAGDAVAYTVLSVLARLKARRVRPTTIWERDDTRRGGPEEVTA